MNLNLRRLMRAYNSIRDEAILLEEEFKDIAQYHYFCELLRNNEGYVPRRVSLPTNFFQLEKTKQLFDAINSIPSGFVSNDVDEELQSGYVEALGDFSVQLGRVLERLSDS